MGHGSPPRNGLPVRMSLFFGSYGEISRYAQEARRLPTMDLSRSPVGSTSPRSRAAGEPTTPRTDEAVASARGELEQQLAVAVVLDKQKQEEFASVGQAVRVSLPQLLVPFGRADSWPTAECVHVGARQPKRPVKRRGSCWRFAMHGRGNGCGMRPRMRFTSALRC